MSHAYPPGRGNLILDGITHIIIRQFDIPMSAIMPKNYREADQIFTIMIVDDSAVFRACLGDALHKQFQNVNIVNYADGVLVSENVKELNPHLIFMDIKLPGQNGIELVKLIKENHMDTYVVVMTLYESFEYRELALNSGADHFVRKDALNSKQLAVLVSRIFPRRFPANC